MQPTAKYTFSGHESFACKSLWLKKGYDFVKNGHNFNAQDAVVQLGVGKNMVASIRYWMKAFGMCRNDLLTDTARLLLDTGEGFDPLFGRPRHPLASPLSAGRNQRSDTLPPAVHKAAERTALF